MTSRHISIRLLAIRVLNTLRRLGLFLGTDVTHPTPAKTGLPSHLFTFAVVKDLGDVQPVVPRHTLPASVTILCQRGMGPQSRGTTGQESQRAQASMDPGDPLPVGHWPRHPVLVASPPTDMLRRLSSLGHPGRAAQSCALQPWRSTTERWWVLTPPQSHKSISPRVLVRFACAYQRVSYQYPFHQ